MSNELQKLRIDKSQKARRDSSPVWPWLLVILMLGAGGVGVWQWKKGGAEVAVETMLVRPPEESPAGASSEPDDLVVLQSSGYVIAAHKIELASRVSGQVAWIGVEMGDRIDKDQVLVRLKDDEYKARVAMQQGQLDNAKARLAELKAGSRPQEIAAAKAKWDQAEVDLEYAQRSYKRVLGLRETRSVTQPEIDDAEGLMKSREALVRAIQQEYELIKAGPRQEQIDAQAATVSQLEGSLAMSMIDLDNTVIRAPIASTVLERNVEVGEFVTNGFVGDRGAKGYVVSLADMKDLLVELDVSQENFAKVTENQACLIGTDAYPDKKYKGKVELISPLANRQKATVEVRVRVLEPDHFLKPDMNANVSFLSQRAAAGPATASRPGSETPATAAAAPKRAIRIPESAIRNNMVWVVEDGKAVERRVKTGLSTGRGQIEILSGLRGGEDLILNPPGALKNGDPVRTPELRH